MIFKLGRVRSQLLSGERAEYLTGINILPLYAFVLWLLQEGRSDIVRHDVPKLQVRRRVQSR